MRDPKTIPQWNLPELQLKRRIGAGEVGHAVGWDELIEEQRTFQATKMAIHAAMVDRMDREIGRVLARSSGSRDTSLTPSFLSRRTTAPVPNKSSAVTATIPPRPRVRRKAFSAWGQAGRRPLIHLFAGTNRGFMREESQRR